MPKVAKAPRDFQRKRCYDWEVATIASRGWTDLSLLECEGIVTAVFRRARRRIPEAFGCEGGSAGFMVDGDVEFPDARYHVNLPLVLHECAHGLIFYRYPDTVADHGPEFMATLIRLLARYAGLDAEELRRSAMAAGLKVGRR